MAKAFEPPTFKIQHLLSYETLQKFYCKFTIHRLLLNKLSSYR